MRRRDWIRLSASSVGAGLLGVSGLTNVGLAEARMQRTVAGGERFRVMARAPTGIQPKSVQISPNGQWVYVCNFGRPGFRTVTVHDPETLRPVNEIEFEGNAVECVFRRDSSEAFVSNFRRRCVEQIDCRRGEVVREIRVGPNPKTMALSPDERTLYVANWSARCVSVVDLESGRQRGEIETGRHPRGIAVGREGNLYVASFAEHFVHEFSPSGEELRRLPTCPHPRHLVFGPEKRQLYITCTLGSLGWWDVASWRREGFSPTGQNPRSLALSGDAQFAALANFGSGDVSVVNLRTLEHRRARVMRADRLVGLAFHPHQPRVYTTSWTGHELIALRPRS